MCKINGKKLEKFREQAGITRQELANKIGLSASSIQKYETGKLNPSDERVNAICMILKINRGEIEIHDVGYSFLAGESKTVNNTRKRKGFVRYSTPEQTEEWISEKRKLIIGDEEESEIKTALNNSFGIGKKRYILINPLLIHVPEWQRNTDMAKATEIAENFNEDKFDPVKIYIKNGKIMDVADGAHRVIAYIMKNEKGNESIKILAEVLSCDEHDAVLTFLGQQAGRKTMSVSDTYRAGIKANIKEYVKFKEFFESQNIQITAEKRNIENPIGNITPSSTVLRMVNKNKDTLFKVINLIKKLEWCGSEKNAFVLRNFTVLGRIYANFGELVEEKLIEKCKGATFYENKVVPIKSNAELYDALSQIISK